MLQYLVFLGAAVNIWGAFFYIRDTLRGETKPNRATWLMWSIAPLIATVAALSQGVGWAVLPVLMAGFGPLFHKPEFVLETWRARLLVRRTFCISVGSLGYYERAEYCYRVRYRKRRARGVSNFNKIVEISGNRIGCCVHNRIIQRAYKFRSD